MSSSVARASKYSYRSTAGGGSADVSIEYSADLTALSRLEVKIIQAAFILLHFEENVEIFVIILWKCVEKCFLEVNCTSEKLVFVIFCVVSNLFINFWIFENFHSRITLIFLKNIKLTLSIFLFHPNIPWNQQEIDSSRCNIVSLSENFVNYQK